MDERILQIVMRTAGIAGLVLLIFYRLFLEILKKIPGIEPRSAPRLLVLFMILVWSVAVLGVSVWAYTTGNGSAGASTSTGLRQVAPTEGVITVQPISGTPLKSGSTLTKTR